MPDKELTNGREKTESGSGSRLNSGNCDFLNLVIKTCRPKTHATRAFDWVCEACEHRFRDKGGSLPRKCLKCGEMEAVRSVHYECIAIVGGGEECGCVFEAYRTKGVPRPGAPAGGPGGPENVETLIKLPDGEWIGQMTKEGGRVRSEIECPDCGNNDRRRMRPAL